MNRMYHAVRRWYFSPKLARRAPLSSRPRLTVEVLENRLAPAADFRSIIGLDQLQALYPYRGTGYTVAVLDTGINYNLPAFGGGIGPGHRVVAGYNFVNNTTDAMDDNGHGTFVAGMIGSADLSAPGIAPEVQFVDLKVLDDHMNGTWSAIDNALKWVIAHQSQYNIVAINLSFGSGNYTSDQSGLLQNDFAQLKNLGVFTSVAAGNNFAVNNSQPGLSYPAVDPNVVSVGATWAGTYGTVTFNGATDTSTTVDQLAGFSQRSSTLSVLAPGAWVTSLSLTGGTRLMGGTSMATAVVTGAAALLHQAMDQNGQSAQANESGILQRMQATGITVVDNNPNTTVRTTGLTFKRLDLKAAMDAVVPPASTLQLATVDNQTMQAGQNLSLALSARHGSLRPITYSAQVVYLPALAYQLRLQQGFLSDGNYYTNRFGFNERWIYSSKQTWFWLLPNGELRRWAGSAAATLQDSSLVATLDATYYADPTLLWKASPANPPMPQLSWNGNQLSIQAHASWTGTYTIMATASDDQQSVHQSFNVTVTAASAGLALTPVADRTVGHANRNLTLTLQAAGTGLITYSARVLPINGQTPAVGLSLQGSQLSLTPAGSFLGTYQVQWSASDGQLSTSQTFSVTVNDTAPVLNAIGDQTQSHGKDVVVSLNGSDAEGDVLSYTAQVLSVNGQLPALGVNVQGNQLIVHPQQQLLGTYAIQVTVSDGALTATRTFNVTLTNNAPVLNDISDQTMAKGQTSLSLVLPASDVDNDTLSFQAVTQVASSPLAQLRLQYGLRQSNGSYYTNHWGMNEKWILGNNSQWYLLMPNGNLNRWAGSMADTLKPANLVAALDVSVYLNPRLLLDALPTTPALKFSFQGNVLNIQRPSDLTGTFLINVSVSDSWTMVQRVLRVTLM